MHTITLHHTLPNVFAARQNEIHSDIWLQDVMLERGRTYLIEAASGTGKSSLCSYLIGYRHDYAGIISFDGRDIRQLSISEWVELRQLSLSTMFQELRLFPELTAWENVQIKNTLTHTKTDADINRWFEALGIADKRNAKVGRMSFGQQQRVALMRALVQPFDFLLADEPISHLDDENGRIMGQLMTEEASRQGATIIITSIGKHIDLAYDETYRL